MFSEDPLESPNGKGDHVDVVSDSDDEMNFETIPEDDEDGDNEALMNKIKTNPYAWSDTAKEIEGLKKERHDLVHELVCTKLQVPFGEKPLDQLFSIASPDFDLIKSQTPDIVLIEKDKIQMIDVTVSVSSKSTMIKRGKYEMARQIIQRETKKKVQVHCIRLDPTDYSLDTTISVIDESDIAKLYPDLERINSRLDFLYQTDDGKKWLLNSNTENRLKNVLTFPKFKVLEQHTRFTLKAFRDDDDLTSVLEGKLQVPDSDHFLNFCLDVFTPDMSKLTNNHKCDIESFWNYHRDKSKNMINDPVYTMNNMRFRSYLPLPNVDGLIKKPRRETSNDGKDISLMLSMMGASLDEYCSILSRRSKPIDFDLAQKLKVTSNFECYRICNFTPEERSRIALEGPGRKRYSLTSPEHRQRSMKNKNYWIHPDVDVEDILQLSFRYSRIDNPSDHPSLWTGPGLDYLRFCQEIYREININCLRKATNKCHIIRPTIYEGIFVIIHPGPLLKSGESSTIIWFKLVAIATDNLMNTSLFESNKHWKTWNHRDKVWSSRWLSTDSNRLDHYIRSFDKIIMSYASYSCTHESSMRDYVTNDRSNTLGLMILIYLEDKRSTSKMIQDIRYIFMMKMSVYDHSAKTLDRFKVPIRTPLQLYLLKKITNYLSNGFRDCISKLRFGKIRDLRTSTRVNDKFSGADISLNRILTTGPPHTFDQMLHEVYFCMLFNKNQDNVTHASFQILSKMLEGERSLEEVKKTTKLYLGSDGDPYQDAKYLIENDHRNQFSRHAIIIGSILQSRCKSTLGYSGETAYLMASNHISLNKTVNEFATFKSSSLSERLVYEDLPDTHHRGIPSPNSFFYDGHDMKDTGEEMILNKGVPRQNRRRRCVQGVIELMKEGKFCSFDVVEKHYDETEYFQVFKKNQIGGVREILILSIEDRIMINVIETFSRLICARDTREMLTHGPTKNARFQSMLRNIRSKDPTGKVFHLNFDKSKWGPSFQPIQFLYIFYPFKHIFPDLFNYFTALLIKHTNKQILLPERLIRAWVRDPMNIMKHNMDPNLQKLKEKFLKDKVLHTGNESNMGQGILHFTSSLLHLCLISFRDRLFEKWLVRRGLYGVFWDDILSSDDSYTCLNVGSINSHCAKNILDGFLHCQEISERLFNCETSLSKSSISNIFCEFNSLFGVNLSLHPTRIKFALSTMDVFYTDSFVRMVKESFNVCRALFENGGQLDLYKLAHDLNKVFCEDIYAVNAENNPSELLGVEKFPYQLGLYPVYEPILMLIFGPEMHNMSILLSGLNDKEKRVFNSAHTLGTDNLHSVMDFSLNSDVYVGIRVIDAKIKPSRLINLIRRLSPLTKDRVKEIITSDPLILLRPAKTKQEIMLKVSMKLYQNSSAEAARLVNPAFFYGRMSASRSAKCFVVQGKASGLLTYKEALASMLGLNEEMDSKDLYPSLDKYSDSRKYMYRTLPDLVQRDPFEIKRYHRLVLQENDFHLKNSLLDILSHMWVRRTSDNSLERDAKTLCNKFGFLRDLSDGGIQESIRNLSKNSEDGLSRLLLIIMRIISDNYKPMKMINYGDESSEIIRSIYSLNASNHYDHTVGLIDLTNETEAISLTKFETVKLHLNMCSLFCMQGEFEKGVKLLNKLKYRDIEGIMKNPYIDQKAKQVCFLYLLKSDLSSDATTLVKTGNFIISKYIREQKMDEDGNYYGPGEIMTQCGDVVLSFNSYNHTVTVNKLDVKIVIRLLKEAYRMLGISKSYHQPEANYLFDMDSLRPGAGNLSVKINKEMPYIRFVPGKIVIDENRLSLKDKITGKNVIQIKNYLLPTESRHWDDDFPMIHNGCSVKQLIYMGFFSTFFALEDLSRSSALDAISEINFELPPISISTKENLGLEDEDGEQSGDSDDAKKGNDELEYEELNLDEALKGMDISGIILNTMEENTINPIKDVVERIDETSQLWWENGDLFELGNYVKRAPRREPIGRILSDRINHAGELLLVHSIYNISELSRMHMVDIERFKDADKYESLKNAFLFTYDYLYGGLTLPSDPGEEGCISYLTKKFLATIGFRHRKEKMKLRMKK